MGVEKMAAAPRPRPPAAAATLTPREVLGILRRHILLIVSLTILGFIASGAIWLLLVKYAPKYSATTYIKVLPPIEKDPMEIRTGIVNKDIQYGHRATIAALIRQQTTLQRLIARNKIQDTNWFKRFGKSKAVSMEKAFKDLKKNFSAYPQRDGDFVVVSMTCGDDEEAALIVNEMVELFIALQGSVKRAEVSDKLKGLRTQRIRVMDDLNSVETTLNEIRKSPRTGIFTDLEERDWRDTITLKLDSLELEQNNLLLMLSQVRADVENLRNLAEGPINEQVKQQIEVDPTMIVLAQQLAFQRAQLTGRLTKFGENHRVVRQTREQINATEQQRKIRKTEIAEQTRQANLKNAQNVLVVLQNRFAELQSLREEAIKKKEDLDRARAQYEKHVAIRDERKQMLDLIGEQIEKLSIMHDDPETPKVRFVEDAPKPLEMSASRQWWFYFPGGTTMGLIFGIALAFLIEVLNDLVRTPRDVGRYLHIPLLGIIPDVAEDEQVRGVGPCYIVREAPYSIISESYRRFRTNLKLSASAQSAKVLLISSGMPGDGKTSVAVNLAMTLVAENRKVLLMDANFWRPSLQSIFQKLAAEEKPLEQSAFGLSNLLMGQCSYQDAAKSSGIKGFDIICSGPLPLNPAELLSSTQMENLIKEQSGNYDYVIVDGPPVLLVSDVKVLARLVDGTILVFNANATTRGAAQRTIRELKEVNAMVVGCVLFAVKAMKGGYFHEQFRSYEEYRKPQLVHSI